MTTISKVSFSSINAANNSDQYTDISGTVIVLVPESSGVANEVVGALNTVTNGQIGNAIQANEFKGKIGQSLTLNSPPGMKADRIVFVGVGKEDDYKKDINSTGGLVAKIEGIGGEIAAGIMAQNPTAVTILADQDVPESLAQRYQHLAMGFALRSHAYTFKTDEASAKAMGNKCTLDVRMVAGVSVAESATTEYANIAKALGPVLTVREWVDTPANLFGTGEFVAAVNKQIQAAGNPALSADVMGEDEINKYGMGGVLAVSRGSRRTNPPRVVVMRYEGAPGQPESGIALLGKGVVFDTGGHSLKPTDGMLTMQIDKGGACATWGAMQLLALLGARVNLHAVLGIVENAMDGESYPLGSIITHMPGEKDKLGKTSKIENTDAEGRLVLFDISSFAQRELDAKKLISTATLTGACMYALGNATSTGFLAKNPELRDAVLRASAVSGENVWQLPYHPRLDKQLDSPYADMRNVGAGPLGGATLGACYVARSILPGNDYLHFDIAGTVAEPEGTGIHNKGGTGAGVRLLAALVQEIANTRTN
ncbi:MAG: hypothetical protein EYC62_07430 [Alphaproteobacteria bacterium]|nr:MAG: hypothetical protein EYC62_07430 [Alphaproteobacteria bacterium]